VVSTDDRRREDGVPSPDERTCVPALQPTIRTQARRTMCRSVADVLSTSPKSPIASASDRDIGRGRHTRSKGGSTRRRRGRDNLPSRPTIWGMTVVDRSTITEQFFGRFHAHDFPIGGKRRASLLHQAQAHPSIGAAGGFLSRTGGPLPRPPAAGMKAAKL
jgi:hypothetical protein